jgi:hypothetical protein
MPETVTVSNPSRTPVIERETRRTALVLRGWVLLLAASTAVGVGCAAEPDTGVAARLGAPFELRVGQAAIIGDEELEVRFAGVTSDSRCGKGETCVWEGDASVTVVTRLAGAAEEQHALHTSARFPDSAMYQGYSIRLALLSPAPAAGITPAQADYRAVFEVTRGASGRENVL